MVFQHVMNNIFREFLDDFVVIYIDDILIYSKNKEDLIKQICMVLNKLCEMGLYAKLDKCEFHQSQVNFFVYIVSNNGVSMDPKKIQTIVDWITLVTIHNVQCFLGFANFYWIFIKSYSNIITL